MLNHIRVEFSLSRSRHHHGVLLSRSLTEPITIWHRRDVILMVTKTRPNRRGLSPRRLAPGQGEVREHTPEQRADASALRRSPSGLRQAVAPADAGPVMPIPLR